MGWGSAPRDTSNGAERGSRCQGAWSSRPSCSHPANGDEGVCLDFSEGPRNLHRPVSPARGGPIPCTDRIYSLVSPPSPVVLRLSFSLSLVLSLGRGESRCCCCYCCLLCLRPLSTLVLTCLSCSRACLLLMPVAPRDWSPPLVLHRAGHVTRFTRSRPGPACVDSPPPHHGIANLASTPAPSQDTRTERRKTKGSR